LRIADNKPADIEVINSKLYEQDQNLPKEKTAPAGKAVSGNLSRG
jgi:hypothetical protein